MRFFHYGLFALSGIGATSAMLLWKHTNARSQSATPSLPTASAQFAATAPALPAGYEAALPDVPKTLALKQVYTVNPNAYIPPQCYTKTVDEAGTVHNPCYTCHVSSRAPNFINDADIQLGYSFVPRARKNHWKNLFIDWTPRLRELGDAEILAWVRTSNYFDDAGEIVLAKKLVPPPSEWDHADDGVWKGFIPDAHFRFDSAGFDRLPGGGYSGWRAFAYYPVPGTFWPTNGSASDVLVRLPEAFRRDRSGTFDVRLYALNLAIVEATVTRRSVPIDPTDEAALGVDLDQNGTLARATVVRFVAEPPEKPRMSYVGEAREAQLAGKVHLAVGLYPEGTEFLHTVRYLDPTADGIRLSARMKELRYARKVEWWTYERLDKRARVEAVAKIDSPTELRNFGGNIEEGVDNAQGWRFQGFIEDAQGALRPQSFEETVYCIGCHGGTGAVDDAIFSFSRRLGPGAFQKGWHHWTQRGLERVPDRVVPGGSEYVSYLERNGAGDEFRQNGEVREKFFDRRGRLKPDMKMRLERDVTEVLLPSAARALALDKAYRLLVAQQNFWQGREIILEGARNVHRSVADGEITGIEKPIEPGWNELGAAVARSE